MHTLTIAGIIGGVATGFMLAGAAERISEAMPQSMAAAPTQIEIERTGASPPLCAGYTGAALSAQAPDIRAILAAMTLPVTATAIGEPPEVVPPRPRRKPLTIEQLTGGI